MFRHVRRRPSPGSAPFVRPHDAEEAFPRKDLIADSGKPIRVSMLGRPGCHLCDRVRTGLEQVTAQTAELFIEASIDDHPDLLSRYGEWIPVIFLDGQQFDYYQLDVPRLVEALTKR